MKCGLQSGGLASKRANWLPMQARVEKPMDGRHLDVGSEQPPEDRKVSNFEATSN